MHVLNHKGKYLSVRGPLNIARPVQGWPLIVQAGASEDGRQLAAETAEAVFTGGGSLSPTGKSSMPTSRAAWTSSAATREHLKILPGAFVVVGDSVEEAKEKRAKLDSMVHYDSAIASLSVQLGTDASGFDPDGQLPPIPETNASKSGRQRLVDVAARDKLTVRQLAQRVGGYGGLSFVGTPATDRRPDGGMADEPRQRRLQHHVPVPARRPGRFRRQGGAGTAEARDFPAKSMRAGRCGRIWACRGRKTGSSRVNCVGIRRGFVPAETLTLGDQKLGCAANAGRLAGA